MSGKVDALIIAARAMNARGTIMKGERPTFAAAEFDDGLLELAKFEKRDGETDEAALDRLIFGKDERARALYAAARRAEALEPTTRSELEPSRPAPKATKRTEREDAVLEHARKEARPGESVSAALDRLSRAGDVELRKLYAEAVA